MNPFTGSVSWSNPKDTTIQSMTATRGTNGTASVTITGLSTLNNPAVVQAVGVAQSSVITVTGNAADKIAQDITAAAGTVGGAAVGSAIKAP